MVMKVQKLLSILVVLVFCSSFALEVSTEELNSSESRAAMEKLLKDYIGLYQKETLPQWKSLFHPAAMIMFPADDGTITVRNVEEFYERQRNFFAQQKAVSERLENVQIHEGRRISRVIADFVFISDGTEEHGKLGLHFVESNEGWKITALVFSYDKP
jgi:SnoaL-like domain